MADFNALIAVLEQRDRYADDHLKTAVATLTAERDRYRARIDSLVCFDIAGTTVVTDNGHAAELANSETAVTNPKTCAEIKSTLQRHANELSLTDEMRFRSANLAFYYDQYKDGVTQKAPQIIPALRLLESDSKWLTLWARSRFELIEMFLLVCMGLLGGVISVMRCFVDPKLKTPASQCFSMSPQPALQSPSEYMSCFEPPRSSLACKVPVAPEPSQPVYFLLAGLGLASGFCATDALAQIEAVAARLLRGSGRDANGGNPLGSTTNRGDTPDSGPAAVGSGVAA